MTNNQAIVFLGMLWSLSGIVATGQDASSEGVRQLYYFGAQAQQPVSPEANGRAARAAVVRPVPRVLHLGLRYNVLLVDNGNRAVPVDSSRLFRKGDCVALELEANQSAHLYVMARQSSRYWMPLIPSPELPTRVALPPGRKVRVPKAHCFQIEDPPGTESMIVILSRDSRDFERLYAGIKASFPSGDGRTHGGLAETRPLEGAIQDVTASAAQGVESAAIREARLPLERPNTVYVVNTSKERSATLVARIDIRHQ
jgi:hypothetical protein